MNGALVWLGVAVAGGIGAVGRLALGEVVTRRAPRELPWGTFTVNVVGSALLGFAAGRGLHGDARLVAATGLLGAFTTFSTWMLEAHRLLEARRSRAAWGYVALSLAAGALAFLAGRALGRL